jgi:membrane associated rhomboid family serine protease
MFFLIPIGHEELKLRGLPFATIGIMVICIVLFVVNAGRIADDEAAVQAQADAQAEATARPAPDGFHVDDSGDVIETARTKAAKAAGARKAAVGDLFTHRWGWVPGKPGVGILTHVFLHADVALLIINLVFLWVAGAKLEELWSRWVFLGAFLLFGVVSALVGGLAGDPATPILGASGAVAGLLGAMLVRLGKSKIHFAYFVWFGIGKPRAGTFEAPAYAMPPLWLLTQLGVQLGALLFTMSVWSGGASYAHWFAGFAFGAAAAFALKRLRFEERFLGHVPETKVEPEDMPLVAFQRRAEPARPANPDGRRPVPTSAVLVGFDRAALRFETAPGVGLEVPTPDVRVWTVARVTRIAPSDAELFGGADLPRSPAVLLAFVVAPRAADAPPPQAIFVDAARLKYAGLLDSRVASPKEAFFRLVALLNAALPAAAFAGDRTRVHGGALPDIAALADLQARLEDALALLKPSARP